MARDTAPIKKTNSGSVGFLEKKKYCRAGSAALRRRLKFESLDDVSELKLI